MKGLESLFHEIYLAWIGLMRKVHGNAAYIIDRHFSGTPLPTLKLEKGARKARERRNKGAIKG